MKVYYDKDADLSLIKGKQVTIVGYGSQGHAHAQNLRDSGVNVTVALRKGGASWAKAEAAGLKVEEIAAAVKNADVVMILLPDEHHAGVYRNEIEGVVACEKAGVNGTWIVRHVTLPAPVPALAPAPPSSSRRRS